MTTRNDVSCHVHDLKATDIQVEFVHDHDCQDHFRVRIGSELCIFLKNAEEMEHFTHEISLQGLLALAEHRHCREQRKLEQPVPVAA